MTMKRALAVLLTTAVALSATAAERRRTVAPPDDSLTITFVESDSNEGSMLPAGNDAWLDLKSITRMGVSKEKTIRTRHRFGVRVVRAGGAAWGTAVITALLDSYDGRATYRLDGRPLTTAPLVVDAHAAVGTVVFHTLDVEVPVSVPEGPLAASINWQVTTE
jgi:hypothetical protein